MSNIDLKYFDYVALGIVVTTKYVLLVISLPILLPFYLIGKLYDKLGIGIH